MKKETKSKKDVNIKKEDKVKKDTKKTEKVIIEKEIKAEKVEEIKEDSKSSKPKKKRKKIEDKKIRILRYVIYVLIAVLLVEGIYFVIRLYNVRKNTTYYSAINSIVEVDDGFIAVGLSDSKNSKFIKYEKPGYNKPYLWEYDKDLKIVNEVNFELAYNGEFNDIIEVYDGYIVVGSIEMSELNHEEGNTEGVVIKYDKDLKIVWRKNLDILGNTKFNAVKVLDDGTIVIAGTSVYPSDVIGNHTHGGAIIARYTSEGEQLSIINYGGPKTGEFNDIVLLNDGLIAVGVRSSGTGIIFKYDYSGKEVWHNYYGYTDAAGLTSITQISNNEFVITGSKLENKDETDSYQAALLKIDGTGKIVNEKLYQKSKITRFQDSLVLEDKLYVIGLYGQKVNNVLDNDSVLITYTTDFTQEDEKVYEGDNTYTLNKIIAYDNSYILAGHTDSKIKELKTNGLDYYPIVVK